MVYLEKMIISTYILEGGKLNNWCCQMSDVFKGPIAKFKINF